MMTAHQDLNAAWMRLESLLTALKPGESVSIDALAAETGLTPAILLTVLKELQRVELFTRQDEKVFVRRSLWQQTG
jgi:DNA-binding IscR family transcriptional regulator